jgi:hypothetical protein
MNKGESSGSAPKGGVGESAFYIAGAAWKATLFQKRMAIDARHSASGAKADRR